MAAEKTDHTALCSIGECTPEGSHFPGNGHKCQSLSRSGITMYKKYIQIQWGKGNGRNVSLYTYGRMVSLNECNKWKWEWWYRGMVIGE